ncbi:MAG: hypothetical protein ACRDVP_10290 [Acidimicrobiales bacterium]
MAQPTFVPITEADQVRAARRLSVPGPWFADRPADIQGPDRPSGRSYGTPGPDQGFALALARRFEDRLSLSEGEDLQDVLSGCALLGAKRAALVGRAPCVHDIDAAVSLFGFLVQVPPEDLVARRRELFESVAHDYVTQRTLADSVPDATLLMDPRELVARLGEWRHLLGSPPRGAPGPQPSG